MHSVPHPGENLELEVVCEELRHWIDLLKENVTERLLYELLKEDVVNVQNEGADVCLNGKGLA